MEGEETEPPKPPEPDPPLHKVFVNLALENDLKGEELEWFKSKISQPKKKGKKEKKTRKGFLRVKIIPQHEVEVPTEETNKLLIKLKETETLWFLTMSSHVENNIALAENAIQRNKMYQMKKTKKEIIRKRCMADTQTPCRVIKSKEILTSEIVMKNTQILASDWDLYDTYNAIDKCVMPPSRNFLKFVEPTKSQALAIKPNEENAVVKLFSKSDFKYASLVTERLLASNCFQDQQSIFKTKFRTRYDTEPTLFTYNMETLWSFQSESVNSLAVTAMDWNPINQDLLAVCYGDLNFEKKSSGVICVWSSKNPRQPEKQYLFEESITSLQYSRVRPNILAVGTRSGNVYVLDVSTQEGNRRLLGSDISKTHPGPVWKLEWFNHKDLVFETEELLVIGEGGVLMIFSPSIEKHTKDLLKLEYVTTKKILPEKETLKKALRRTSFHLENFDKKVFSGLCFSIFCRGYFCYISTKEGVLVKCNLRNPSMNDGVFLAHDGPAYIIQHSPVTDLIYLTCGADWRIKIWMEGITQPLIVLQQKAAVVCARWSPTIPTLIASAHESELSLWDFSRNFLSPMSTTTFQNGVKTGCLLFSTNGANLMVGDEDGLVHVVHLSELPRIPFLQKEALINAIRKNLLQNNEDLYEVFFRAVETNKDALTTQVLSQLENCDRS